MLIPVPYRPIAVSIYASKPASDAHVVEIERRVRSGRAAEAEPVEFAEAGAGDRQIGEGLGRGAGGGDRELEGAGGVLAEGGFDLHMYPHFGRHLGQDVSAGCHVAVAINPHGRADVLGIGGRIVAPLGEEPGAGAEPDVEALLDRAGGETRLVVEVGLPRGLKRLGVGDLQAAPAGGSAILADADGSAFLLAADGGMGRRHARRGFSKSSSIAMGLGGAGGIGSGRGGQSA